MIYYCNYAKKVTISCNFLTFYDWIFSIIFFRDIFYLWCNSSWDTNHVSVTLLGLRYKNNIIISIL